MCIVRPSGNLPVMLSKRQFIHQCAGCAAGLFTSSLLAREGVEVGKTSAFANLVPAAQVEGSATQQYGQMLKQALRKMRSTRTTIRRYFVCVRLRKS